MSLHTIYKGFGFRAMAAILACSVMASLISCSNDDDQTEQPYEYTGVPLIILDTDIGSSTDDLFTMMMLYRYQDLKKSRLLGVVVNREGEECAACADVMVGYKGETFFTPKPTGNVRYHLTNDSTWDADMLERIRTFNKMRTPLE